MSNWLRVAFAALIGIGAMAAHAQPCTITISPGANLTQTVEGAANGAVICLNAGTYNPATTSGGYSDPTSFAISRPVTVRGADGTVPSQVLLQGGATSDFAVKFMQYIAFPQPNGATLSGLTVNSAGGGSHGGIQVYDFQTAGARLNGITIRNVIVNTRADGIQHGILVRQSDRIVIDGATVTANQTAINLLDAVETLLMNSTIPRSGSQAGLSVVGGASNVIVGNTFGTPKVGATYSFQTGGVVFYNTRFNRFEHNTVQGHKFDGVDLQALDGAPYGLTGTSAAQATQNSTDNYVGKNNVISTGFGDGLSGGSGMWSNCSSNNTWMYGNDVQGSVECGICVWLSRSNMLQANSLHNHGISGIFTSGGAETIGDCYAPAYRQSPIANFLHSNNIYFNRNDQVVIRNAFNTEAQRNYLSPTNGFGGAYQACNQPDTCQSAFSLETDASLGSSGGHRLVANTSDGNKRPIWTVSDTNGAKNTNLQIYLNRLLNERFSRYIASGPTNIDGGTNVGGNFWTEHDALGNPSTATPYTGVFDSVANSTGQVTDRFPYQTEDLGRGGGVTVFEPRASSFAAVGSRRTVRWNAPGCTLVDVLLDGVTPLLTDWGNTGYAVVTIPAASIGVHNIAVSCKDSFGVLMRQAASPNFNVSASTLRLLAPGRDDVFNAGQQIWVAWVKDPAIPTVTIELSIDGGATFPTILAAGVTGTSARVTLPAVTGQANAVIRVSNGTTRDYTDGVFAIHGTGSGFTAANFPAARQFVMGSLERLEWVSPVNSRVASITASVNGGAPITVVTDLPDRGFYDWLVPDIGVGNLVLTLRFEQSDATTLVSTVASNTGTTRRASTVTFNPLQTAAAGTSQPISATTNSGVAVTLSSLTPGTCTLSSGSVNSIAEGTCLIQGSTAGNANYAAAAITTNFLVSSTPPRLANISTRMQVLTGNDVMIGGFVISGSANKTVVVRARGPSLVPFGITNALADPTLQLVRSSDQSTIAFNDNWQTAPNSAAVSASGFAPSNNLESAILVTLAPGAYTAIVAGAGGGTGVGIVEVFEVDHPEFPLANISTRGRVFTGNDVMIGGFVIQGAGPQTVVVRARGPSLIPFGIPNALADPVLQLVRSSDQVTLAVNDNWDSDPSAGAVMASGFAPANGAEAAIYITLQPGAYTVIVTGAGGGTGVGIVEVFKVP